MHDETFQGELLGDVRATQDKNLPRISNECFPSVTEELVLISLEITFRRLQSGARRNLQVIYVYFCTSEFCRVTAEISCGITNQIKIHENTQKNKFFALEKREKKSLKKSFHVAMCSSPSLFYLRLCLHLKVKLFHFYYSFQLSHLKEFIPRIMLIYDSSIIFLFRKEKFRLKKCFEEIARFSVNGERNKLILRN